MSEPFAASPSPGAIAPAEAGAACRSATPREPAIPTLSFAPVALPGADTRIVAAPPRRPRTATSPLKVVIAGGIVAALLGSGPLLAWTESLANPGVLQRAAQVWQNAMTRIGLTAPDGALRRAIRAFEAERFAPSQDAPR